MEKLYFGDGTFFELPENNSIDVVRKIPWKSIHHRGYAVNVHYNTIPAYYESLKNGSDGVEIDVVFTKDGVPIICHDTPQTMYLNGVETSVSYGSLTYEELSQYTYTATPDVIYGDIKIPTLQEVLDFARIYDCILEIDGLGSKTIEQVEKVAQMVVNSGCGGKMIYLLWNDTLSNTLAERANAILSIDREAYIETDYDGGSTLITDGYYSAINTDESHIIVGYTFSAVTNEIVNATRNAGYKIHMSVCTGSYSTYAKYCPDYWQYEYTSNIKEINNAYLDTLDFGKGIS